MTLVFKMVKCCKGLQILLHVMYIHIHVLYISEIDGHSLGVTGASQTFSLSVNSKREPWCRHQHHGLAETVPNAICYHPMSSSNEPG